MKILETPTPPAANRLLRETVYATLRADILRCVLAPGTEVREGELATRFEVSKSPVRDALMRLEREGLIITTPRQGYRVAPISFTDVQDMFHLRAALESACMERIVEQSSDAQLAALEPFRNFDPAAWSDGFVGYNRAFHTMLATLANNARICDQLGDLIDQMERVVTVSVSHIKQGDTSVLVDEHCKIIDALQERKLKRAERLAQQHIGDAEKRVNDAISRFAIIV